MISFAALVCLLASPLGEPINVGQLELRRSFEIASRSTPEALQDFKASHFVVGLEAPLENFRVAQKRIFSHPFDSMGALLDTIRDLATPLLFALLTILFFHLWNWALPISRDASKLLRSPGLVKIGLVSSLLFSLFLNSLMPVLLIFSALCLCYSRHLQIASLQFLAVASFWIATPISHIFIRSAEEVTAIEALHSGRTRLEYSESSLQLLNEVERAYWADWNGAREMAQAWIAEAPTDLAQNLYKAIQVAQDGGPVRGLTEMQKVYDRFGANPYILFNLAHLNVQTQNLVAADRARDEIPRTEIDKMSQQALQQNRSLLWLPARSPRSVFSDQFFTNLNWDIANQSLKWIYFILTPIFLGLVAIFVRRRASGICDFTGELTPRVTAIESPLYLSSRVKGVKGVTMQRSQIDLLLRAYQRSQQRLASRWTWLVPGLRWLIIDHHFGLAFIITAFIYLTFYFGLPSDFRDSLKAIWPLSQNISDLGGLSFRFLPIAGLIVYIPILWSTLKRSGS